jgi:hypothetical protein
MAGCCTALFGRRSERPCSLGLFRDLLVFRNAHAIISHNAHKADADLPQGILTFQHLLPKTCQKRQ